MTETQEADCLSCNPFEGDFGSPGDRVLKDKIGTARKAGECHDCTQQIQPGERIRIRSEISDGELMSFRWCQKCCEAKDARKNGHSSIYLKMSGIPLTPDETPNVEVSGGPLFGPSAGPQGYAADGNGERK